MKTPPDKRPLINAPCKEPTQERLFTSVPSSSSPAQSSSNHPPTKPKSKSRSPKHPKSIVDVSSCREVDTYSHDDKTRVNNPKAGLAHRDTAAESRKAYSFDPHLSPRLDWAGKQEHTSFDVPTSSIHIHESIKPHKIIRSIQSIGEGDKAYGQLSFFETPLERMQRRRQEIEFYEHQNKWTNRLIAGDSLVVMNSLLEKEGMAGQVQMVYIDPPYGIKYGSNFQPFVDRRDVKDKKDEDLTQEPEMIKAFRDTWELGIHSYLSYLRDRLLLARELLADSGSVFVQISDENVHHVRELCDEVFGCENFVSMIAYEKTSSATVNELSNIYDIILWYSKDKALMKYNQLFKKKTLGKDGTTQYVWIQSADGKTERRMTPEERNNPQLIPSGWKVFACDNLTSQSGGDNSRFPVELDGIEYCISKGGWKTGKIGFDMLKRRNRIKAIGLTLMYKRMLDDFPVSPIANIWSDVKMTGFTEDKIYVVQTSTKAIQRCMLMTTDPGDLVLDITCGSGTTAYVAEQWGRRWITCDTSRVALTLAKQRLMTATFDYYKLAHEAQGVGSGFIYKTVPHITLKSIANNEPPATETLYDQPLIDKNKARVTGPFTVEALPAPVVRPLDGSGDTETTFSAKQMDWCAQLLATGILGRGGQRLLFSRVELIQGTRYLQAEAETKEDSPRRAVVCFSGETKPLDARMVEMALDEAEKQRPKPQIIVFAAFQFDPTAASMIDDANWPGVTLLKAQMNTDLMTDDLKKKRSSDQSFWLVGQPDVELIQDRENKNKYKVRVNGFDYYNVKKGMVESGSVSRVAMWMLDRDYDGMCVEPHQVFFPMGGQKDGWNKLAKTLKAEIDQDLVEQYAGNESLWFEAAPGTNIAVKIIDDRGIESLKIIKIGD
ncbi:MAG: site-specific DNA-methyltransferase [Myxococcaceae bacterium]|nr:site-specific DNA-methyltransferase [Myxococcaceae bacterium]